MNTKRTFLFTLIGALLILGLGMARMKAQTKMSDGSTSSPCGMCFAPDVGPEDPSCSQCHYACTPQAAQMDGFYFCMSCSNYPQDYDCQSIYGIAEAVRKTGKVPAEMAAKTVLFPSIYGKKQFIMVAVAGLAKYGSHRPHPSSPDELRQWAETNYKSGLKCIKTLSTK